MTHDQAILHNAAFPYIVSLGDLAYERKSFPTLETARDYVRQAAKRTSQVANGNNWQICKPSGSIVEYGEGKRTIWPPPREEQCVTQ